MLELYDAPQSTCSQKVRLTLAEKNLEFVEHKLKLFQNEQLKPEYLKLNPNGVVPTLVDGGAPIIDSSVIMEYLDEEYPKISLTPAGSKDRAKMRTTSLKLSRNRSRCATSFSAKWTRPRASAPTS